MHTVDLLEQAIGVAGQLGYAVRQEWLGGQGGGGCVVKGQKCLFVDLALPPAEQLAQVADTLRRDAGLAAAQLAAELRQVIAPRWA